MSGSRSSLCRHFFRLWDEAAAANKPLLFMLLENVSNILSVDLYDVMKFLLQENSRQGFYKCAQMFYDVRSGS
ncbi:unnamed protein product [Durusdinium trenchii]|uniref:Uncharacterized protein n=1 Tax=Durusdinium trenchii TaxID=1381693 RepID=A0ABP0K1B3_9DINO